MRKKLRLIVLGAMGRMPFAGVAWQTMQYVEGLRRLGHDVYYIEDTWDWPFDPIKNTITNDSSYTVAYLARLMEWCGMSNRWAYRAVEQNSRIYGLWKCEFVRAFERADALINLNGATELHEEHFLVPVRSYLYTDPGANEIKVAKGDPITLGQLQAHTHFFNFGENLGTPECPLPTGPFRYRPTRQPIVLDWFAPLTDGRKNGKATLSDHHLHFTTVGNWKQEGRDFEWNGESYTWSKHTEFLKFIDVPRRTRTPIELALACEDIEAKQLLARNGWKVVDALPLSTDIQPYREYILNSDAEFTVAKDQNVRLRTGWFSDRSASYLAAGKPVVTQDTAFGRVLPTGMGLFAFTTMDDIIAAFEAIHSDYERHSRAARAIAEEYFRAETVLTRLIADLGL